MVSRGLSPTRCPAWCAAAVAAFSIVLGAGTAVAQDPPPDPRAAMPERPTVATHAFTVAPGIFEIEVGAQEGAVNPSVLQWTTPLLLKIGLTSRLQLDIAPSWVREKTGGASSSGVGDTTVGLKWRLANAAPVLGAFAVQATLTLPTGSVERGTGTGTTGVSCLLISSHQAHGVAIDINAGYTRRGGDGSQAPRNATVWTLSSAIPLAGPAGLALELFGFPGTAGPAGSAPAVGLLMAPTYQASRSVVLDAGVVFQLKGSAGTTFLAGLTWNIGRAWSRHAMRPTRQP